MKFDSTVTLGVIIHLLSLASVIVGTFVIIRNDLGQLKLIVTKLSDWMQEAEKKLISIDAHMEARKASVDSLYKILDDHENRLRNLESEK